MDPRLAQILQTLKETTPNATPPPIQHGQSQYQPSNSYDPRKRYQPDDPRPPAAPHPVASISNPPSQRVDPRTITEWPAALKYVTTYVATNEVAMNRLKRMKVHQLEHERLWFRSREDIVKRHSNSGNSRLAMNSVLQSFGVASNSSELTAEQKQAELAAYDSKVYKASLQMYDSMAGNLAELEIPFFVVTEKDFAGNPATFSEMRRKVVELLDDLT